MTDTQPKWTRDAAAALHDLPFMDLLFRAQTVHRAHFDPNAVQLSRLLSIKTGGCAEDCAYCPQAARWDTGVDAGKLLPGGDLSRAYTPSFSLLGAESLILEQSDIGQISDSVKDCLRCGKCKPVCSTHVPRANLFYSPRDKILSTSLLIEAFLYEEQTRRGVSLAHWAEFEDVADHCTICHKCEKPCPVDIDFGDVSIKMRNLLRKQGKRSFNPGKAAAMAFLTIKDPTTIKAIRTGMIDWGYKAQRFAHDLGKRFGLVQPQVKAPPATLGKAPIKAQVIHFINKPMPGNLPKRTSRALLDIEDDKVIPVIRDPHKANGESEAVFYFPGCGSERLFSQVGLATQAMLYHVGAQTVLPPGYLCCGYPQTAAGEEDKGQKITTDNRVLFHRVANTLNYLDIKTVIVSCGTCMDQLQQYEFDKIFPGCRLLDIHEYLMEKGVKLDGAQGVKYMYHEPCHTPMKVHSGIKVANALMGTRVDLSDRCCGESGTLAVARPDISTQVRFRKQEEIEKGAAALREDDPGARIKMLTSCPSCLQGMHRYANDAGGIEPDYIVVELARQPVTVATPDLTGTLSSVQAYLERRKSWRKPTLMGLAHECQKVGKLAQASWDVPLQGTVTDRQWYVADPAILDA